MGTGQAMVGIGVAEGLDVADRPGVADGPGVLDAELVGDAGIKVSDAIGGTVVMTTGVVSATSVGVGPVDSCEASNPPASTVATTTMPVAIPPSNCRPPLCWDEVDVTVFNLAPRSVQGPLHQRLEGLER
jgi:hypothetical protein